MKGIFAVYKPIGITSFRMIDLIRKLTGVKKVGHAGTLDPLAEGILVVGVGREATRKLDEIVEKEKEYITTIKLGENSVTDDGEGEKSAINTRTKPTKEKIQKIIQKFIGEISQVPPKYSAIKIKGKRAYKSARKGEEVNLKARKVFIRDIRISKYKYPFLTLKITTGKGVYIRSLARDIGKILKTGGYVFELKRTKVGKFNLKNFISLEKLTKEVEVI